MGTLINIYEHISNNFVTSDVEESYLQYVAEAQLNSFLRKPTEADVIKAINNRNFVGIYYEEPDDKDLVLSGFRLIEPYVFGSKLDMSVFYIRAYVIKETNKDESASKAFRTAKRKSASKTKRIPYWRMFRLDRIQDWQIFPWKFSGYRELYTGGSDKHIPNIITSVPKEDFPKGEIRIKTKK